MEIVDSCHDDARWRCDNTDGTADELGGRTCEDCGDRIPEDDGYWTGRGEDHLVCESCCDDHYAYVYGRRGSQYYVHEDDAVRVDATATPYDVNYLSDNNIVELHDGDYAHTDDAVYIDRLDEWHLTDDCTYCEHSNEYERADDCVVLHSGEHAHEDDVWMCEHTGDYYLNEDEEEYKYETECGKTIHIDHADQYIPQQTTLDLE